MFYHRPFDPLCVKELSFSKHTLGDSETQNILVNMFLFYKLNLISPSKNKR